MNYTYEIILKDIILERLDGKENCRWNLYAIQRDVASRYGEEFEFSFKSFVRTRQWLEKSYPELMI